MLWITVAKVAAISLVNGFIGIGARKFADEKFEVKFDKDENGNIINPKTGTTFKTPADEKEFIKKKYTESIIKKSALVAAVTSGSSVISTTLIMDTVNQQQQPTEPNSNELR